MSDDVLITPASRKIEFKDNSGNIDGKIELDSSGNLKITSPGGGLELGDAASDIYVGNGSANIDIIFEQNGEIRGTTGRTVTLGQSDSNITVNALNFNTSTSTLFKSQNGITSTRIVTDTNATGGATNISSFTAPHTIQGINNGSTQYALLATLPATGNGTLDHVLIEGSMGGWTNNQTFRIKFKRRDNFGYEYTLFSAIPEYNRAGIVAYQASNGTVTVHAKLTASTYGKLTYTISHSFQVTVVDKPSLTTSTPAGTLVFDSNDTSTYPPTMKFPDNQKLEFGADGDLQIYHDSSNSIIKDNGTGNIEITGRTLMKTTNGETMADFIQNGRVDLYYDNSKKFETKSSGIEVTGNVTVNNGTNKQVFLNANDGNIEITRSSGGAFIDFKNSTSEDFDARLQESSGHINLNGNAIITTGNASTPSTTTSSSDADHVLINDGGVMKKITPANLGIGGGGGASSLNGLSDVTISSVQNNDLLKYNSTASRWENTNLGISLDPTLAFVHPNSAIYGGGTVLINVTNNAYGNNVYQDPHFFCELRNSSNTIVISNDNITYEYSNNQGRLSFSAPLTSGTYTFKAKVQDFGDLESEFTTLSVTVSAIPSMRYWRLKGDGGSNHTYVQEFRLYQNANLGGTKYPPDLSSSNQGSSETINGVTYIADSSGNYSTTSYHDYKAFDNSPTSSGFWNIGFSNTYSNWFLSIDMGQAISISSVLVGINSSFKGGQQGAIIKIQGSSTGSFSGEEITLDSFDSYVGMTQGPSNLQYQYG